MSPQTNINDHGCERRTAAKCIINETVTYHWAFETKQVWLPKIGILK